MPKQIAILAFKGETMCFVHALLNALDMHEKGFDVKVILEGAATGQISQMPEAEDHFAQLYRKVKEKGLVDVVCQACAKQMNSLEAARAQSLPLSAEMSGHPPLAPYVEAGYQIITF
ncbi:MAG: DsrE family protein [Phycisphaerae bacterium]